MYSGCLGSLAAAAQPVDTLREAPVVDYRIEAPRSFKETTLRADSLNSVTALNLGEALRQTTGIFVKGYGSGGIATLSLRGTGANHTKVYWNNLDVSSPSLGLTDLSTLPVAAFDQLQLQYGFAGLSDGSGALGGSLRLRNTVGWQQGASLAFRQMAGSFGRYQSTAKAEYGDQRWRGQTGVYYYRARNNFTFPDITQPEHPQKEMQNARNEQIGAYQNLYWRSQKRQLWSLKTRFQNTRRQLPPPLTANPNQYDRMEDRSLNAILEWKKVERKNHQWLANSGLVVADNIFRGGGDTITGNNSFSSWQNNLRKKGILGEDMHWEVGGHYRYEWAQSPAFAEAVQRHYSSVFAQAEKNWGRGWRSELLLRQELVDKDFSPLIGSLGATYAPDARQTWRLNAARNYRFPTLNDRFWQPGGNPLLQPEKSMSFELGYERRDSLPKGGKVQWSGTAFYNKVNNWIQWAVEGNIWRPQNLKEVRNYGLEVSAQGFMPLGPGWKITHQLAYTYTRSRVTAVLSEGAGKAGRDLPYVPRHKMTAGAGLQFKAWELRYQQQITDRYFTNSGNSTYMPAYHLAQASLRHRDVLPEQKAELQVAFTVHNMYNRPYQIMPFRPEPGIHYSLQLTLKTGL